jgi:hypothetical protein
VVERESIWMWLVFGVFAQNAWVKLGLPVGFREENGRLKTEAHVIHQADEDLTKARFCETKM